MGDADSNDVDWPLLESLFEAASELPEAERGAFLESACAGRDRMREELHALLSVTSPAAVFFSRMGFAAQAMLADEPAPSVDPLVGATIHQYRIEERLGAGGMGVVYRAYDERLHRAVALKFLPLHASGEEASNRRFFAEARAAAALDHPNICTIYEVGETADPRPFIAMAYYPGETLDRILRRGPLEIAVAIDYAVQIARGLAAAHQRGIVHRDIKPGNVMITSGGMVKILDFGLARLGDSGATRSEGIFGTVAYMSPERAFGRAADLRTDLWSLGVALHEMVTGERPFRRDSEPAVLHAIAHEEPADPLSLRPDLAAPLARIIHRLLEKDPARRYADAREVIADLEAIVASAPATTSELVVSPGLPDERPALRTHSGAHAAAATWWHRNRRRIYVTSAVAAALIAAGLTGLAILARPGNTPLAARSAQPNVAVLYFQDDTESTDRLAWLPTALTNSLIGALANVQGISPLSLNAVRPYRESPRPTSAIAADLGAAWLVDGFIDRIDGRVFASAELVEGATGRRLDHREMTRPLGEERALIEDVVRGVIEMLRERLGSEMRLGRWQAGTNDSVAFRLLHIAAGEVEEADELAASASPSAGWARLRRADSTLSRAAAADPEWPEPLIQRAWVANKAARLAFGVGAPRDSVEAALSRGIDHASAAVRQRTDVARALEARGVLRHTSWLLLAADPDTAALHQHLIEAERDLRDALEADPGLARALNSLSAIEYAQGRLDEARVTTERAYRADRFLAPEEVLGRLFNITFETGDDAAATQWCTETASRFPASWFVAHCRLMLMAWSPDAPVQPDSAWRWVMQAEAVTPEAVRAGVRAQLDVLVAGVLARANLDDSARAVLHRVDALAAADPRRGGGEGRLARLQLEAGVRVLLHQPDSAMHLLEEYIRERPDGRAVLSRSRRFRSLDFGGRPGATPR